MKKNTSVENLHLVVFSEQFYPDISGGSHTRWQFSKNAVKEGAQVTVFTFRDPETVRSEFVEGVEIRRPVKGGPSFIPPYSNFSLPFRILSSILILLYCIYWFYYNSPDAIHSTSHTFHWVGKVLGLVFNIPLTNFLGYTPSVRYEDSLNLRSILEYINFKLFMGDIVFCRTPKVRSKIEATGHTDVRILHGILNKEKIIDSRDRSNTHILQEFGIAENEILITFVGRFVPIKRPKLAVEVLTELPNKYKMTMIGEGRQKDRVKEFVKSENLSSRVDFAGELPHKDTLDVIQDSDILILTSKAESYGAVVFEALALGSAVITPPIGILPKVDHPRLYVTDLESYPDTIRSIDDYSSRIDEETAQTYSMDRYTADVLEATRELI